MLRSALSTILIISFFYLVDLEMCVDLEPPIKLPVPERLGFNAQPGLAHGKKDKKVAF